MNINKILILTVTGLSLTVGLAQANKPQQRPNNTAGSFGRLVRSPFTLLESLTENIVIPVVKLPGKIVDNVFGNKEVRS